jgi:hypothetical protein
MSLLEAHYLVGARCNTPFVLDPQLFHSMEHHTLVFLHGKVFN